MRQPKARRDSRALVPGLGIGADPRTAEGDAEQTVHCNPLGAPGRSRAHAHPLMPYKPFLTAGTPPSMCPAPSRPPAPPPGPPLATRGYMPHPQRKDGRCVSSPGGCLPQGWGSQTGSGGGRSAQPRPQERRRQPKRGWWARPATVQETEDGGGGGGQAKETLGPKRTLAKVWRRPRRKAHQQRKGAAAATQRDRGTRGRMAEGGRPLGQRTRGSTEGATNRPVTAGKRRPPLRVRGWRTRPTWGAGAQPRGQSGASSRRPGHQQQRARAGTATLAVPRRDRGAERGRQRPEPLRPDANLPHSTLSIRERPRETAGGGQDPTQDSGPAAAHRSAGPGG